MRDKWLAGLDSEHIYYNWNKHFSEEKLCPFDM